MMLGCCFPYLREVYHSASVQVLCCPVIVSLPYSKLTVVSRSGLMSSSSQRVHVGRVCETKRKLVYFNREPITDIQAQTETFMIMCFMLRCLTISMPTNITVSDYNIPTNHMHMEKDVR